jgi:FtsP/CotA-like multicopper oxidase with cupredoxin domain
MDMLRHAKDDGTVGLTQGTIEPGQSYLYTFKARPAGATFYHGHYAKTFFQGNLGKLLVRKRPGNDPHAGKYDEERYLAITSSLPFIRDPKTNKWRHMSAEEDWNARYAYGDYDDIPTDFGGISPDDTGTAESEQPWSGMLIEGKGRGCPVSTTFTVDPKTGKKVWPPLAPCKGSYFTLVVTKGKRYRLRILSGVGQWGFRMSIQGHPMTVLNVMGRDIEPFPAPKEGIECQPVERHEVLLTANQTVGIYRINIQR